MTKPPANVLDLPLEERAEMALKAAVEKVILGPARDVRSMFGVTAPLWKCLLKNCASAPPVSSLIEEAPPQNPSSFTTAIRG